MLLKEIEYCICNERQELGEGRAEAQESLKYKISETAAKENAALSSFSFIYLFVVPPLFPWQTDLCRNLSCCKLAVPCG